MKTRLFTIHIEDYEVARGGVDIEVQFLYQPTDDELDEEVLDTEENIEIAVGEVINALAYYWPVYVQKVLGPSIQFHVEQALGISPGGLPVIEATASDVGDVVEE